jgi:endothelin-converting enzyme/putative endopeptidase
MKKLISGAVALLVLSACGQQDAEPIAEQAPPPETLGSGLDLAAMDKSVKPGDDFFAFMNGTWIKETEIPADRSNYGGFSILRDEAQADVKVISESEDLVTNCFSYADNSGPATKCRLYVLTVHRAPTNT